MNKEDFDIFNDYAEREEVRTIQKEKEKVIIHVMENLLLDVLVAKFLNDKEINSVIAMTKLIFSDDTKIVNSQIEALRTTIKNVRKWGLDEIVDKVEKGDVK